MFQFNLVVNRLIRWVSLIGVFALVFVASGAFNPPVANAAPSPNCTYTIGYWKNHPDAWPASQVTLGNTVYQKAAAIAILSNPGGSDATNQLAAQLIAAKLNVLKGANNSAIASTITQADNFLKSNPYGSNPQGANRTTAVNLGAALENWNSGKTGPGHCDDASAPTPTKTTASKTNTPAQNATNTPVPSGNGKICWQGTNNSSITAQTTWTVNSNGTVTVFVQFSKNFVDNTYGTNAIGWGSKGHTFGNLTGSDHVQLALYNGNNSKAMEFKVDYLTASNTVPSGYKTLGVSGGDGGMLTGSASDVLGARTSLSENFNTYGYGLTTNSPATDFAYTPNANYPNWIFDVWYEVTVKTAPFGSSGFGKPVISSVHASPSKTGNNTEPVKEIPCASPTNTPAPNATRTNTPANAPTPTPSGGSNCTYTQGYWKNHPASWPVQEVTIGGVTYSKANAISQIFNVSPQGDATYVLAHQLLAAKLNVLKGAAPAAVASAIPNADALLQANPLGSNPQGSTRDDMLALSDTLDDYNNGRIGPGHCGDETVTPAPSKTPRATNTLRATNTPVPAPTNTPTPCSGGIFGFVRANGQGLQSVKVTLKNSNGNKISETQTNSSGAYLFQPLANGSYIVEFETPKGYTALTPTAPSVNVNDCGFVQVDFELAAHTPTPTKTPVGAPTLTNTPDLCGNLTGAIFTTNAQGNRVNQNIYAAKEDVYLQGGPDQQGAHLPDGLYYYRVTDPSGGTILFLDGYRTVTVSNNVFPSTQLFPYEDTPNNGDEYKVWLSRVPTFENRCTKTDNFKVRRPASTATPAPPTATRTNTPVGAPTVTNTPDGCANLQGAIFTTDPTGQRVNQNIYTSKLDVYLQGGPDQQGAHLPDGLYYYRVTDPSGATILYPDGFRVVVVQNNVFPATQLAPFNDTPNNGDEYKAWLSRVSTFDHRCTKTDNFKVRVPAPTATPVQLTATRTNTPAPAPSLTPLPTNTPTATRTNTPAPAPSLTPTNTPTVTRTPAPQVCVGTIFGFVREGVNGVANVNVTLKDSTNTNTIGTTATDVNGFYAFPVLTPGSYFVHITVPAGYTAVGPTIQGGTIIQSGQQCTDPQADFELARFTPTPTNTATNTPTNTPTRTNTPAPAPSLTPTNTPTNTPTRTKTPAPAPSLTPLPTATPVQLGSLCALVYHDLNGNAIRNAGEPLLSNAVVTVKTLSNVFIGSFTTNGTEPRCFTNLIPGTYVVTEQDPGGFFSTTSNLVSATVFAGVTVTVEFGDKQQIAQAPTPTPTRPPAPAPPITIPGVSEPKGLASLNNRLFIASRNTNTVFVLDEVSLTILRQIPVGNKPWGVGAVNGKIYVANNFGNSVSVINPITLTKTKDITFNGICDGGPANLAVDTINNRVYIAVYGNRVAVIDAGSDTVADCISTAGGTFGVAVNPFLSQLYVSNRDDMSVQVFDVSTTPATLVQTEKLGGVPYFVAANLSTNEVYVSVAFNPPDYDLANNLEVFSAFPGGMSLTLATITGNTHDGGYIMVSSANGAIYLAATQDNQVQVLDPITLSVCATFALTDPFGMTENPGLGLMWFGLRAANQIDSESNAACGGPPGGP